MRVLKGLILLCTAGLLACTNDGSTESVKNEVTSFVTLRNDPTPSMWWVRAEYHPFGTVVRGLPVGEIDGSWCNANELTRDLFPADWLKRDGEDILEKSGQAFAVRGRFDGMHEHAALVGAFETCDRKRGTFLLLLDENKQGKEKIASLHQFFDHFQLPSLFVTQKNNLELWWCIDCDNYQELYWNAKKQSYAWRDEAYYYGVDEEQDGKKSN